MIHETTPQPGEHTICYAYPSSDLATRMKRARSGCYVVQTSSGQVPCSSYLEALMKARAQGTAPSRWSIDHPLNAEQLAGVHGFETIVEPPGTASPVWVIGGEIRGADGAVLATCDSHVRALQVLAAAYDHSGCPWTVGELSADELASAVLINRYAKLAIRSGACHAQQ